MAVELDGFIAFVTVYEVPHHVGAERGADAKTLRDAVDRYKDKLQSAVIVVGSVDNGKVRLAAGVTKNNIDRIKAGDVIRPVAEQVGGKGGGRPDFAQAGGNDPEALDAALASVSGWVAEHLS